jgi:transcriptional regulator with XRE-family HTH domain
MYANIRIFVQKGELMVKLIVAQIAKQKGINQSRLQIKSGVTPPLLNRYWNNHTQSVGLEALGMIAEALGVKPGDLIVTDADYQALEEKGTEKQISAENYEVDAV